MNQECLTVSCHPRDPSYDDPVLRAVAVDLQRQPLTWVNRDVLDLEAVTCVHRVVASPGPIGPAVGSVFVPAGLLQSLDHRLHILRCVPVCDEHRIDGIHDDQIGHPDRGHQPGIAVDKCIASILNDGISSGGGVLAIAARASFRRRPTVLPEIPSGSYWLHAVSGDAPIFRERAEHFVLAVDRLPEDDYARWNYAGEIVRRHGWSCMDVFGDPFQPTGKRLAPYPAAMGTLCLTRNRSA